jgi:Flp pilus assembly pilin Flp
VRAFTRLVRQFVRRESGATAAEYAVLLACVMLACAAAIAAIGPVAGERFIAVGDSVGTYEDP